MLPVNKNIKLQKTENVTKLTGMNKDSFHFIKFPVHISATRGEHLSFFPQFLMYKMGYLAIYFVKYIFLYKIPPLISKKLTIDSKNKAV